MEADLHNVIKKATILKDIHKQYIMCQLFRAVRYLHSGNVLHRDLKPSNVLLDADCRVLSFIKLRFFKFLGKISGFWLSKVF